SASTPSSIIATASALTTISNDDSFTYGVTTALGFAEGNSGSTSLTFTVTRTGTGLPSSVAYNIGGTATNGSDFNNIGGTSGATALQGIINFGANETTKTITVDVLGDTIVELDETITVTLSNSSATIPNSQITTPTATFVIFDDDQPRVNFGSASFTQAEGNTVATVLVPITLSDIPLSDVIIPITINANSTASAADYTLGTTSITFAAGTTNLSQNVAVDILPDDLPEDAEKVIINFGAITGALTGSVNTAIVNIPANDPLRYTVITSDATILEGNSGTTPVTFTVNRSGGIAAASNITYQLSGTADGNDYTISNSLNSTGTFTFAANETSKTLTVNVIGDTLKELNENITLTLSNPSTSTPTSIIDTPQATTTIISDEMPELASLSNQLFRVNGSGVVQLQFNKRDRNVGFVNEVGAFVVDGNDGNIGGILPGQLGYLTAAMNRARAVFSGLRDSVFDTGNQRILSFNGGDLVAFFLVVNGSLEMVRHSLSTGNIPNNLVFAMPGANSALGDNYLKITPGANGVFNLGWEDGIGSSTQSRNFGDFSLDISIYGDPIPFGVDVHGNSETIDLRGMMTPTVNALFQVGSDAAFNNFVGFYTVDDAVTGQIGALKPGDVGYAAAAINNRVAELNRDNVATTRSLNTGVLLAPFVIANGDVQDWLVRNLANADGDAIGSTPVAYFSYGAANPDQFDHIRLLGNNTFGFEDLPNGGDQDFNDIVMRVSLSKP
ncbi:MAG: Calx-beta domain-containing protein, partial [Pseudanabaena sp. ELA607]